MPRQTGHGHHISAHQNDKTGTGSAYSQYPPFPGAADHCDPIPMLYFLV
jgi:hypothetical protein